MAITRWTSGNKKRLIPSETHILDKFFDRMSKICAPVRRRLVVAIIHRDENRLSLNGAKVGRERRKLCDFFFYWNTLQYVECLTWKNCKLSRTLSWRKHTHTHTQIGRISRIASKEPRSSRRGTVSSATRLYVAIESFIVVREARRDGQAELTGRPGMGGVTRLISRQIVERASPFAVRIVSSRVFYALDAMKIKTPLTAARDYRANIVLRLIIIFGAIINTSGRIFRRIAGRERRI